MNTTFLNRMFGRQTNDMQPMRYLSNTAGDVHDKYAKFKACYINNGAYDSILRGAFTAGVKLEAIKPYRTPVFRSVQWYSETLVEDFKIQSTNQNLKTTINQILKWTNFEQMKRELARVFALYGDAYVKVLANENKTWWEIIKATHVTDVTKDSRGFIKSIRIDIPITDENGMSMTYTEYWEANDGEPYYSIWEHSGDRTTDLDKLGTPKDFAFLFELGIDFIPVFTGSFFEFEDMRGLGSTFATLDKIDELNRMATRMHQKLFRYDAPELVALSDGTDANGRPIPKKIKQINLNGNNTDTNYDNQDMYVDLDRRILDLSGYKSIEELNKGLNFADALAILKAQESEIEKDLPEIQFVESNNLAGAGVGMRLRFTNLIGRTSEARSNLTQLISRAIKASISMGQFHGLFPQELGTFDNGDFDDFEIKCKEILGLTVAEKAEAARAFAQAGYPLKTIMRQVGESEQEIEQAMLEKDEQTQKENSGLVSSILGNARFNADANATQ